MVICISLEAFFRDHSITYGNDKSPNYPETISFIFMQF